MAATSTARPPLSPREMALIRSCVSPVVSTGAVRPDWFACLTGAAKTASTNTPDRLLKKCEVAARIGVSLPTLEGYINAGKIAVMRLGQLPRIRESVVENFLSGANASPDQIARIRAKCVRAAAASVASRKASRLAREG